MNPFVFEVPTRIEFGEGLAGSASEVCKRLGAARILIVTDEVLIKNGVVEPVLRSFQEDQSLSTTIFTDVPPDSDIKSANKAAALAVKEKCDAVLAVGGGSVLDTAKVVNISLTFGGDVIDYQGMNNLSKRLLPFIAIPTTAGTGSEVSAVAMVKDSGEGKKLLFASRYLAPDASILDPTLLVTLPPRLTAATGLDAVTHCIEAYSVEFTRSPLTDMLCLEGLRLLFEFLPKATKHGDDLEARSNTLIAATMAGMAFTNSGVGVVHALSHATGGQFGTHHGTTNSVFLPWGMQFNLDVVAPRYAAIARYLKLTDDKSDEVASKKLIVGIQQLAQEVGLPSRLRDLGVPALEEAQLENLAYLATTDPAIMFNPKETTVQDIIGIYERAY
jgi:alcohol dehydrogenase class IV